MIMISCFCFIRSSGHMRFYLQNIDLASFAMTQFNKLEKHVVEMWPKQKQSSIDDFFKKRLFVFLNVSTHLCKMKLLNFFKTKFHGENEHNYIGAVLKRWAQNTHHNF